MLLSPQSTAHIRRRTPRTQCLAHLRRRPRLRSHHHSHNRCRRNRRWRVSRCLRLRTRRPRSCTYSRSPSSRSYGHSRSRSPTRSTACYTLLLTRCCVWLRCASLPLFPLSRLLLLLMRAARTVLMLARVCFCQFLKCASTAAITTTTTAPLVLRRRPAAAAPRLAVTTAQALFSTSQWLQLLRTAPLLVTAMTPSETAAAAVLTAL